MRENGLSLTERFKTFGGDSGGGNVEVPRYYSPLAGGSEAVGLRGDRSECHVWSAYGKQLCVCVCVGCACSRL